MNGKSIMERYDEEWRNEGRDAYTYNGQFAHLISFLSISHSLRLFGGNLGKTEAPKLQNVNELECEHEMEKFRAI